LGRHLLGMTDEIYGGFGECCGGRHNGTCDTESQLHLRPRLCCCVVALDALHCIPTYAFQEITGRKHASTAVCACRVITGHESFFITSFFIAFSSSFIGFIFLFQSVSGYV
jgi:hypothetical protein